MKYELNEDFIAHYGIKGMKWKYHKNKTKNQDIYEYSKGGIKYKVTYENKSVDGVKPLSMKDRKKDLKRYQENIDTHYKRNEEDKKIESSRWMQDANFNKGEQSHKIERYVSDKIKNTKRTIEDISKGASRFIEDAKDWIAGLFNGFK